MDFAIRLAVLLITASGVGFVFGQGNYTALSDAIPQLTNLTFEPNSPIPIRNGGQNFTHCCLLAVNASFQIQGGDLTLAPSPYLGDGVNVSVFQNGQFPCGATFDGSYSGAPTVQAGYDWCRSNCGGWQFSEFSKLQQWVGPLVGFILPCLVFCLTIPRRLKIRVSERLFEAHFDRLWVLELPLCFAIAAVLVTLDTIIWLSICFAFAGPMLLSGVYESFLDGRILRVVNDSIKTGQLTAEMRARLLFIVLIGNLDMKDAKNRGTLDSSDTPWNNVAELTEDLRRRPALNLHPSEVVKERAAAVERVKTRLSCMLACQYSFGSTIGAPVVFFVGAFVYTLVDILARLGDNDTSHALAFGMWWMTIPHVAIVAGLLLAGNNPNTLEGVLGKEAVPEPEGTFFWFFTFAYESRYRTQWLSGRGANKRRWVYELLDKSTVPNVPGRQVNDDLRDLKQAMEFHLKDWLLVLLVVAALIGVPSMLACLTSFNTPRVGLSCRSLTFLVYGLTQGIQVALWLWDLVYNSSGTNLSPQLLQNKFIRWIWFFLAGVFGAGSAFTGIGGTWMQIMGVYRNCFCKYGFQSWGGKADLITLSTNSAESIRSAATWWQNTAGTAIIFLGVVCYGGWWYQKSLRSVFRKTAGKIDHNARAQ